MHQVITIALLGCIISCTALATETGAISYSTGNQNTVANLLNREQLFVMQHGFSADAGAPKSARLDVGGAGVGILYLRGDGGDPQQVRADDSPLIYITGQAGAGRTYQHGREVDINPAIRESARQIAMQQFRAPAGAQLPANGLPVMAQEALTRFAAGGPAPIVMFARIASREDTGRVSDMMIAKLLSLKVSLAAASPSDMIDVVKTAMLVFGFKSDACDNSGDPRCEQPGIREAFAQIKREEAVQRTLSAR
jgi:phage tail tape-measure protein